MTSCVFYSLFKYVQNGAFVGSNYDLPCYSMAFKIVAFPKVRLGSVRGVVQQCFVSGYHIGGSSGSLGALSKIRQDYSKHFAKWFVVCVRFVSLAIEISFS